MANLIYEGEDIDEEDDFPGCAYCGANPEDCDCEAEANCGRWNNGQLMPHCTKAGSEECDFECPLRDK